jgi:hypothetical protein
LTARQVFHLSIPFRDRAQTPKQKRFSRARIRLASGLFSIRSG